MVEAAVARYIEAKRAAFRNANRIRDELVKIQRGLPLNRDAPLWGRFRAIELILDDIFQGEPMSTTVDVEQFEDLKKQAEDLAAYARKDLEQIQAMARKHLEVAAGDLEKDEGDPVAEARKETSILYIAAIVTGIGLYAKAKRLSDGFSSSTR